MLEELRVRNLALIEDATVHFGPGLNVLSGETGEGKSLVLEALDLLLGERSDRELVRTGAAECAVEGRFRLDAGTASRLREVSELVEGGGELIVRRVVGADGRSRAWIDGNLCPLNILKAVGGLLGDVHRQRDQLGLLRPDAQRGVLDRLAGLEADVAACAEHFERRRRLLADADTADAESEKRLARIDELREAVKELDDAAPTPGEADALSAEWKLLTKSQDLVRALAAAADAVSEGDGAASARLAQAARAVAGHAGLDPRIAALSERLETLRIEAADLGRETARLRHAFDPVRGRIDTVGERLDLLRSLGRKYRADGDRLVERHAALKAELASLKEAVSGAALRKEAAAAAVAYHAAAAAVWKRRRDTAVSLSRDVTAALKDLRLPNAVFVADPGCAKAPASFDATDAHPWGYGTPRFLVSMNVGEPPKPLEEVASGGELARTLLAVEGALAGAHRIPLLVFDEIDAGVGGRVGLPFGRRIKLLARHHQVLVVTHLPQVAAFADTHLLVKKTVDGGRTRTVVRALDVDGRVEELADMIGASGARNLAVAQARDLMKEATA